MTLIKFYSSSVILIYVGLNRSASDVYLLVLCDFPVLVQQHWSLDLQQPENTTTRRCQTNREKKPAEAKLNEIRPEENSLLDPSV